MVVKLSYFPPKIVLLACGAYVRANKPERNAALLTHSAARASSECASDRVTDTGVISPFFLLL